MHEIIDDINAFNFFAFTPITVNEPILKNHLNFHC